MQFWLDEQLTEARPDLTGLIARFLAEHRDRFVPAGNVQVVPGGEVVKNDIHILERMLKCFHAADLDRRSYVVVIGGGAVLDAVGFAAAIAHRGIRLVRLPTTTLGQADSGIGVKNSVNLFGKKNWIGTFAVPWAVVNDAALLNTLSDRDFICGFAEAVKVSLLKDAAMFDELCRTAGTIRSRAIGRGTANDSHLGPHASGSHYPGRRSVRNERSPPAGLRALVGTQAGNDDQLSSCGMAKRSPSAWPSTRSIRRSCMDCRRPTPRRAALPVDLGFDLSPPVVSDSEALFAGLEEFRQHLGGRLTVTMLEAVGQPIDVHEVDHVRMRHAIDEVARFAATHGKSAATRDDVISTSPATQFGR